MKALINGRFILKNRMLDLTGKKRAMAYDETIIGFIDSDCIPANTEILDANGAYISPGFIDLHMHGYGGCDATDADAAGLKKMSEGIITHGVTAWLPTTITAPMHVIEESFNAARSVMEESKTWGGAEILGVNMEGPYLNEKRKGAHDAAYLLPPDPAFIAANADIIKIITIAPETDRGFGALKAARGAGIVVSIGHSDADYETAAAYVENGAGHITHLFNAMSPLNHRDPGVAGAALTTGVSAELIADTFHIHSGLFDMLYRLLGDKLILITDGVRAAGLPEGEYDLGGQRVTVRGIECRLPDGTIAGSVLTMDAAVKNMRRNSGAPLSDIIRCASLNSATVIGANGKKGSLEAGKDADITLFDEDINILRTIKKGAVAYEA